MTESTPIEPDQPALPGLDVDEDRPGPGGELRAAARRSIRALSEAGYLDESHAVLCQLMLQLADAVDAGVRYGKASAAAMAAAQLLATYQAMRPEGGDSDVNEFDELVAQLRAAGSGAPVGDST